MSVASTAAMQPGDLPLAALADLCRRYQVRELLLFRSALGERFQPDSDIDLLVAFAPETRVTFLTLGQMERDLEAPLGRRIDLVSKRGLSPLIREAVLDAARVLYAA